MGDMTSRPVWAMLPVTRTTHMDSTATRRGAGPSRGACTAWSLAVFGLTCKRQTNTGQRSPPNVPKRGHVISTRPESSHPFGNHDDAKQNHSPLVHLVSSVPALPQVSSRSRAARNCSARWLANVLRSRWRGQSWTFPRSSYRPARRRIPRPCFGGSRYAEAHIEYFELMTRHSMPSWSSLIKMAPMFDLLIPFASHLYTPQYCTIKSKLLPAHRHYQLTHSRGVKAYAACCLAEVLRLYAPDAPYTPSDVRVRRA